MIAISPGVNTDGFERSASGMAALRCREAGGDFEARSELRLDAHLVGHRLGVLRHAFRVRRRFGDAVDGEGREHVDLAHAVRRQIAERGGELFGAVPELHRQHRVPVHFLQRLLPPLPAAVDCERESLALEWFDQEIRNRTLLA